MYRFISSILNLIIRKICKSLEVQGEENIPQLHRYVVTCTHESYNEVIMLGMAIYPNQIKLIKENKTVGIFPTGQRMKYDEGSPMKRGAVTIAMMAQAPILPAAYIGPKKIQGLITGKSIIKFGEPIDTKNLPKDMKRN